MKYLALVFLALLTAIAWAAYGLSVVLYSRQDIQDGIRIGGVTGAVAGCVVGIGLWLTLRLWKRKAAWWVLTTVLGWTAGGALGGATLAAIYVVTDADYYGLSLGLSGLAVGTAAGLVIGMCQWLALRSWSVRVWWWIPLVVANWGIAGFVAWAAGWSVGGAIAGLLGWAGWPVFVWLGLITGASAGGVVVGTGTALALKDILDRLGGGGVREKDEVRVDPI